MRTILFPVLLIALSILVDSTARTIAARAENSATTIVTDQDHNVIRFMINGREVARFDADGLQVRNDIEYGGTITDTGVQAFDQYTGDGSAPN